MFIASMFILLLSTLLFSLHLKHHKSTNNEILSIEYNTHVRGIAIFFVIISHLLNFVYLYPNLQMHHYYEKVIMFFIQNFTNIAVGIFLFLSGYGNWFSINKQEDKNKWIINKLLKIYAPVGILCVFSYITVNIFDLHFLFPHWWTPIRNFLTLSVVMWAFWYLKVQAMSYILLYISIKYFKKYIIFILTSFFICYLLTCLSLKIPAVWWFTALCFPFGCIIATNKNNISSIINKLKIFIYFIIVSILLFFIFLLKKSYIMIFISILSCVILTKLSTIYDLKSKILKFMGKYSLELYLVHLTLMPIIRSIKCHIPHKGITLCLLIFFISLICSPILRKLSSKFVNVFEHVLHLTC